MAGGAQVVGVSEAYRSHTHLPSPMCPPRVPTGRNYTARGQDLRAKGRADPVRGAVGRALASAVGASTRIRRAQAAVTPRPRGLGPRASGRKARRPTTLRGARGGGRHLRLALSPKPGCMSNNGPCEPIGFTERLGGAL